MNIDQFTQAVAEFKDIYKQEYGVELSENEAATKAKSLLNLFEILTVPEGKEVR